MLVSANAVLNMEQAAIHNTCKNLKHNTDVMINKRNISIELN